MNDKPITFEKVFAWIAAVLIVVVGWLWNLLVDAQRDVSEAMDKERMDRVEAVQEVKNDLHNLALEVEGLSTLHKDTHK